MEGLRRLLLPLFASVIIICLYSPGFANAKSHEVPVRKVFESMGYKVVKSGNKLRITREQDDEILLQTNSRRAIKNNKNFRLNQAIRYDKEKKLDMINVLDIYTLAKEDKKEKHYRVKKGDTLYSISRKYKASVRNLKNWNKLSSNKIVPGQHLHITDPVYVVKKGESIWEIAHKTESSVEDIIALNDLTVDELTPGQKLMIPLQPSVKPPRYFEDGVFPLAQETYQPYTHNYGDSRSFSTKGESRSHEGIDIMADKWVPVFSVSEGKIVKLGWSTYGGYRITIEAPNGIELYYAHFMGYPPGLKKGQKVSKGQLIGFTGDTGYGKKGTKGKFASHLHFGMYDTKGDAINPYSYLKWWEMQP